MTPQTAILITLVLYKVGLVVLGLWAQRRTRDGTDFFLGGRKLGPIVAAVSASASSSSAWTLMGVSGAAYAWGVSAAWLFPACVGGFVFNWYVLAPRLQREGHRLAAVTVTDVVAQGAVGRGRRAVRGVASTIVLLSLSAYVAAQFQGAGKTFHETFGLSEQGSILIGAGIVLVYTLLGGFWAVSLTDTLQGLVMAVVALVLPLMALATVGGLGGLWQGMAAVPSEGYLSATRAAPILGGVGFVAGILGIGLGYPGQPHVVNRFMALEDRPGALKRARQIALGWAVVVYAGMLVLGWCGRVLWARLGDNEVVLVAAAQALLPPVLAGVALAAVLSAIMSTADSQLLVAASAVTHDLRPAAPSRPPSLLAARAVIVGLSLGAAVAAMVGTQEIFSRVLFAWTAMGSAFGPLLLVTVWRGPVPPGRAVAVMVVGFVGSVVAYSLPWARGGVLERIVPFVVATGLALWPQPRPTTAPEPKPSV